MLRRGIALLGTIVVTVGCSDDGAEVSESTTTVDRSTAGVEAGAYIEAEMAGFSGPGAEEYRCVIEAIVAGIGQEQLRRSGVTPEEFVASDSTADLGVVIDDPAAVEAVVAGCGDGLLVLALSGLEETPENLACVEEAAVDDALVARVLVESYVGVPVDVDDLAAAEDFDSCVAGAT